MSKDREYNGWSNYETWLVALWIDNDPGTYRTRVEMTEDYQTERDLADGLKDWVEEMVWGEDTRNGLASDLLNAALAEVDWMEIAESYWSERGGEIAESMEDDDEEEEEV